VLVGVAFELWASMLGMPCHLHELSAPEAILCLRCNTLITLLPLVSLVSGFAQVWIYILLGKIDAILSLIKLSYLPHEMERKTRLLSLLGNALCGSMLWLSNMMASQLNFL
jgi:hypothetical protein